MSWRSVRAIWLGVTVDLAGSLATTIFVGIVAVTALVLRGDSAERIVDELSDSTVLAVFVAMGGMVMSIAGGYAAASAADRAKLQHAVAAGVVAVVINAGLLLFQEAARPDWLHLSMLTMLAPCAVLGGWLAMPVPVPTASL